MAPLAGEPFAEHRGPREPITQEKAPPAMPRRRPILIGCPQHGRLVRGTCACDERGRYRMTESGQFLLEAVGCDHDDGRCAQTLCALHRFNRRGGGSWYPTGVWAMPQRPMAALRCGAPVPADGGGWYA